VKDLYNKNCKTLNKKPLEDGKTSLVHGLPELIFENDCPTKSNCIFNAIPFRIPMSFFARTENSILKFIRKHKVPKEPNQS
jgi:hypothetical protein